MEIIIAIVALAVIVYVVYTVLNKEKTDEIHSLDTASQAPYKIETPATTTKTDGIGHESIPIQPTISNVLDINNDGKVDIEDAKEAVKKAKSKAKKVKDQATEVVKKATPRGRKPKA